MSRVTISAVTIAPPVTATLTIVEAPVGLAIPSFPRPLPPLEHRFRSPEGLVDYPNVVADFNATEAAGFDTLQGTLEAARVLARPDIYRDGSQWIVTDPDTGETVAAGDLLTPAIAGGLAAIKADGWAKRAMRLAERYLYQARGYASLFVPKHSEPFGPTGLGYLVQSDDYTLSTDGALRWSMKKGSSWAGGDNDGFVAYFGGLLGGVTSIAGHINCTVAGADFEVRVVCGATPASTLPTPTIVHNFSPGGPVDVDFAVAIPAPGPVLIIDVARVSGTSSLPYDVTITITDLRINGIAPGDLFTGKQVAQDIAGRLGMIPNISGSTFNVMPLDGGQGGTAADVLDIAATIAGSAWRVTGTRRGVPLLEWFDLDSKVWEVIDPEFPVDPVPLPMFDSVLMPYLLSNGKATDILEVSGALQLPVHRAFGPVELPDPLPNSDQAQVMGEAILREVSRQRFAGRVTFSRVLDEASRVSTCHGVHSGDSIYLPNNGGVTLRIKSLARSGEGVDVETDDGIAALDRYLARYRRLQLIRHPQ